MPSISCEQHFDAWTQARRASSDDPLVPLLGVLPCPSAHPTHRSATRISPSRLSCCATRWQSSDAKSTGRRWSRRIERYWLGSHDCSSASVAVAVPAVDRSSGPGIETGRGWATRQLLQTVGRCGRSQPAVDANAYVGAGGSSGGELSGAGLFTPGGAARPRVRLPARRSGTLCGIARPARWRRPRRCVATGWRGGQGSSRRGWLRDGAGLGGLRPGRC